MLSKPFPVRGWMTSATVVLGVAAMCSLVRAAGAVGAADSGGLLQAVRSDDRREIVALLRAGTDPNRATTRRYGLMPLRHSRRRTASACCSTVAQTSALEQRRGDGAHVGNG